MQYIIEINGSVAVEVDSNTWGKDHLGPNYSNVEQIEHLVSDKAQTIPVRCLIEDILWQASHYNFVECKEPNYKGWREVTIRVSPVEHEEENLDG